MVWAKNCTRSKENEFILFCDNLKRQVSKLFFNKNVSLEGIVGFGVTSAIDILQPVDTGFG